MEINFRTLKSNTIECNGCWLWQRSSNGSYPKVYPKGRGQSYAHIEMCRLIYGEPLTNQIVMHSCDNPMCINPDHLKWGTHKENTNDMIEKGRGNFDKWPDNTCNRGHDISDVRRNSSGKRRCGSCAYLAEVAHRIRAGKVLTPKTVDRLDRLGYDERTLRQEFNLHPEDDEIA